MEIRKNFDLKLKDYVKFNIFLTKTLRTTAIYIGIMGVIIFLFLILPAEGKTVDYASISLYLTWLAYFAGASLFLALYFFAVTFFGTKRVYNNNKESFTNINLTINEEGLSQVSANGVASQVKWNELFQVKKRAGIYAFLVTPTQGIIVDVKLYSKEEQDIIDQYITNAGARNN